MVRRLLLLGVTLVGAAMTLPLATASAGTMADPIKVIEITGEGIDTAIQLASDKDKARFNVVFSEVSWLAGQRSVTSSPAPDRLGPKYTLVILTDGKATDTYDLYPQAAGGPRAFRPDAQPDGRKVGAGWFYGRLSMPTTLINVGVPLTGVPGDPGINAGRGGGADVAPTTSDSPDLAQVLGDWTKFTGLNSALIIIVAMGIFVLAFVLRKQGR